MSEWISVKDRLPPLISWQYGNHYSELVLCWLCGICGIGQYVERGSGKFAGKKG